MATKKRETKATKQRTQTKRGRRQKTALPYDILPLPQPRFRGRIGDTYADSRADIMKIGPTGESAPRLQ